MATQKKIFKVRRSAAEDIQHRVVASTYEELINKCKEKLEIGYNAGNICLYRAIDKTIVDEELFQDIETGTILIPYKATATHLGLATHPEYPPIVYRIKESGKTFFQIGERNTVVKVNVSEKFTNFTAGLFDSLKNDEELISVDWSRGEDHYKDYVCGVKTRLTDDVNQHLYQIERTSLQELDKNDYTSLRLIIEKFFERYRAMLNGVFTGCLDLKFSFNSHDEQMAMVQDPAGVQSLLSSVFLTPDMRKKYPSICLKTEFNDIKPREIEIRRRATNSMTSDSDNENRTSPAEPSESRAEPSESRAEPSESRAEPRESRAEPRESRAEPRESRVQQHASFLYQTDTTDLATELRGMEGSYLEGASIEKVFHLIKAFPDIEHPIHRNDVLYTVLCIDKSSTLGSDEFNSVKSAAFQFFRDLDDNICDKLDENVAVLAFGSSIHRISGFSFEIQNQMKYIDELRQDVESPSPDIVMETVVAAGMILKKYGKTRVFRDLPSENLVPRIVLITGSDMMQSGSGDNANLNRFLLTLKDKGVCFPVYCLDVRRSQNPGFLADVARITDGKLVKEEKKNLLGAFHRLKVKHNRSPSYRTHDDEFQDMKFLFGDIKK